MTLGLAIGCLWFRWSNIPHWLDMTIGMLTLGNLGMLLGWWADNGFSRLPADCCECAKALHDGIFKPWMPIAMLVFASLAMFFLLRRRPSETRWCKLSMFGGGNLGMVVGMLLGGRLSALIETDSVSVASLLSFLGMTVGHGCRNAFGDRIDPAGAWLRQPARLSRFQFTFDGPCRRAG